MQLRWTMAAAEDLEGIAEYPFEKSPRSAPELLRKIYQAPINLQKYPNLGRPGKKTQTRELVLTPLPYVIVYQLADDSVWILHGAQDWPS